MPSQNLIVRDLYDRFLKCRKKSKNSFGIESYVAPEDSGRTKLLNGHSGDSTGSNFNAKKWGLPPIWVDTLDEINLNIGKIGKLSRELNQLYEAANRVTFSMEKENEYKQKIEVLTNEITRLFRGSQNLLKKIASIGNDEGKLPYQERLVRLNVMRGKAAELQDLSKNFRRMQKAHLNNMDSKSGSAFAKEEDDEFMNFERKGFTDEQQAQILEMQEDQDQRSAQIMNIVRSVEELAQIFNELQILIVQQGTVLDRIDYNVEQTLVKLESAKGHLKKAEKYQKRSMSTLCIFGLLMLIVLAGIILIAKNSS